MNQELIAKAKETKTPEELAALAKETGMELDAGKAKACFDYLHPKTGELADEELDNVAGGGCYTDDGRLKTTCGYKCKHYVEGRTSGVKGTCYICKYWGNDPGAISASLWTEVLEVIMTAAEAAVPRTCYHPANRKKS